MISKVINAKLPNPQSATDPQWTEWNNYIAAQGIQICQEPVIRRYQSVDADPLDLLPHDQLNHLLTLQVHGGTSEYAAEAEDLLGCDIDREDARALEKTLAAFEGVYARKAYRFSADSVVYKGVSTAPYYTMHRFESVAVNDTVNFDGFLSTSVCREKGAAFAGSKGVLLIISGLNKVDCIVLENRRIVNTPDAHIPEHEILLNRGTRMVVRSVRPGGDQANQEVYLEII